MNHFERCSAPICKDYPQEGLIWYPSEEVCKKYPFTKWQKTQKRIQILYRNKLIDSGKAFSIDRLKKIRIVRAGIEGDISS